MNDLDSSVIHINAQSKESVVEEVETEVDINDISLQEIKEDDDQVD